MDVLCLYVSFGSKVRPITFVGALPWVVLLLFIVMSRLLVYSAGSGCEQSACCFGLDLVKGCFVLSRQKLYCKYGFM